MSAQNYSNPEDREKLDQARQKLQRHKQEERASEGATSRELRELIASEDQPGLDESDLPQPTGKTVEWRGTELEFDEMGESLVQIVKMEQEDRQADMLEYVVDTLAEKCRHPQADRDYWTRFDLMRDDETDSLMTLFQRLTGGDLSPEQREQIEEFRSGT